MDKKFYIPTCIETPERFAVQDLIIKRFKESADLKEAFAQKNSQKIAEVVQLLVESLKAGNKILLFGNGGSAADAQHIAAEFVNRLQKTKRERPPLAALALTTDTSVLTSIGNDSDFLYIFSRQIRALGKEGDVAWAITTSGNSPNMITAVKKALMITPVNKMVEDSNPIRFIPNESSKNRVDKAPAKDIAGTPIPRL